MGVEIKLTDKEFPVSPVFVDFLYRHINNVESETTWHDQLSEEMVNTRKEIRRVATEAAGTILDNPIGQKAVYRAYELLTAVLTGMPDRLRFFHERYAFICVVGCPRHGGSYLTKQLFQAVGIEAESVPNVIAHDGFPDAGPFDLREGYNSQTGTTHNMAEFLAMVELFYANSRLFDNYVVVPKKATKAAYQGAFFSALLGPRTEYIITLRHPVAAAISTYEKSGGLPENGLFKVRGNIEEWARRDTIFSGVNPASLEQLDYFDVYLRYWEHYHMQLATSGLATCKERWRVVVYGQERMEKLAQEYFTRYRSRAKPDEFKVFDKRERHPEWQRKAVPAIRRVSETWQALGLSFPLEEWMECW